MSRLRTIGLGRKTSTNRGVKNPMGGTKPNIMTSHDTYGLLEFTKFY